MSRAVKILVAAWLAAALSGCIERGAPPSFTAEVRQSLKLTKVTVEFNENSNTHIPAIAAGFAAQGVDQAKVKEAERAQIGRILSEEFMATLGPKLTGSRPVAAKVVVVNFFITDPGPRLSISAGMILRLRVYLVDEETGAFIINIVPEALNIDTYKPSSEDEQNVKSANPSETQTRLASHAFAAQFANWIAPPPR